MQVSAYPTTISNVRLICCLIDEWDVKTFVLALQNVFTEASWRLPPVMCPPGKFVVSVEAGVRRHYGMSHLAIKCQDTKSYVLVHSGSLATEHGGVGKGVPGGEQEALRGVQLKASYWSSLLSPVASGGFNRQGIAVLRVFGMRLYYVNIEANRGPSKQLILYNAIWEGSETVVSAFFVTMLTGDTVSNPEEDSGVLDYKKVLDGIYHPFALLSLTNPSAATFGLADFRTANIRQSLESFCFLSADNLPDEADFVAGVVHPRGYPINKIFGLEHGYRVKKANRNEFIVRFTNYSNPDMAPFSKEKPTFVAFPVWLDSNTVPADIYEASVSVRGCTADSTSKEVECTVIVGCGGACELPDDRRNLRSDLKMGFSFLAIASEPAGVVHGHVAVNIDSGSVLDDESEVHNCEVVSEVVTNATNPFGVSAVSDGLAFFFNETTGEIQANETAEESEGWDAGEDINATEGATIDNFGFGPDPGEADDKYVIGGGYLITFDVPFEDPPSVVVSPHIDNYELTRSSPVAVVEYVTEREAYIKVGVIICAEGTCAFRPSNFDFVIVGPPEQHSPELADLSDCEN
jgi:hypothetical protein